MKALNAAQTARALPYGSLVPAIARAALELARSEIRAPERMVVTIDPTSVLLCMPAIASDIGVTKLVTVHAKNAERHMPVIQGEVVVFDAKTGKRIVLLDGPTVTARRTAAVTLLGIQALAPQKPSSALLIGTGVQAKAHADALVQYFGISEFFILGTNVQKSRAFCATLKQRHRQVNASVIEQRDLEVACPRVDVLIALTTSRIPVIPAHISPHTLAVGVGAFKPDMAEFAPELLHARRIVVDDLAGARHEAGDLLRAKVDWSTVSDLGSVLGRGVRFSDRATPAFKTVGQAAWDLAAARVALTSLR